MSSLTIGLISVGCIFGGALLGLFLQGLLPEGHLRDNSKDTIKVVAAMIATLAALVLGLLVSSAKSSFDGTNTAVIENGAKAVLLDRALAAYGPETKDVRELLRRALADGIEMFWPEEGKVGSGMTAFERANAMETIQAKLRELTPTNDSQRKLQSQAEQISGDMLHARWLLIEQAQSTLPMRGAQCDRDRGFAHQCAVRLGRDLSYFGNEPSARWQDQSFERTAAQGPGTSRPVETRIHGSRFPANGFVSPITCR